MTRDIEDLELYCILENMLTVKAMDTPTASGRMPQEVLDYVEEYWSKKMADIMYSAFVDYAKYDEHRREELPDTGLLRALYSFVENRSRYSRTRKRTFPADDALWAVFYCGYQCGAQRK